MDYIKERKLTKHVCQPEKSNLQTGILPGFRLLSTPLLCLSYSFLSNEYIHCSSENSRTFADVWWAMVVEMVFSQLYIFSVRNTEESRTSQQSKRGVVTLK